jgi:hypothetical protein
MAHRTAAAVVAGVALALVATASHADDAWKLTGTTIRKKKVAFIKVDVYNLDHYVKEFPKAKTKQALIELDADKKFVMTMLRDVSAEKITNAFGEAFELNGFQKTEAIKTFLGLFKDELKEKSHVNIVYDAKNKETSVEIDGSKPTKIAGADFMKAVWSIWFGKIDQEDLGDELLKSIP